MKREIKRGMIDKQNTSKKTSYSRKAKTNSPRKGTEKKPRKKDFERNQEGEFFSAKNSDRNFSTKRERKPDDAKRDGQYSEGNHRKSYSRRQDNDYAERRRRKEDETSDYSKKRSYSSENRKRNYAEDSNHSEGNHKKSYARHQDNDYAERRRRKEDETSDYSRKKSYSSENRKRSYAEDSNYSEGNHRKSYSRHQDNDYAERRRRKEDETSDYSRKKSYSSDSRTRNYNDNSKDFERTDKRESFRDRDEMPERTKRKRFGEEGKGDYRPTKINYDRSHKKSRFKDEDEYRPSKTFERKKRFEDEDEHRSSDDRGRRSFKQSRQIEYKPLKDNSIRLNKYIANAGICSRREADVLIASGAVSVNGKIITEMGFKVHPTDVVNYGGERLVSEKKKYVLLNKPKGFITTVDDPQERKTVMMLVDNACKERIYPVGRLDRNTTGLLFFTNDGEMAKKLTHPSHGAEKVYHVELDKPLTKKDMQQILTGVELEDGVVAADDIQYVGNEEDKKNVGIQLHTGKNRIVRRIFESLGYEIYKLDRVVFAGLTKKNLPRGKWRFLTDKEIAFLKML